MLMRVLFIATIAAMVTSCKKDDSASSQSNTEKISSHGWKLQSSVISPQIDFGNGPTSDGLETMEACNIDNILTFKADGGYINDEGATKCDQWSSQTADEGTWMFTANESMITLNTVVFTNEQVEVISLSSSQLVVKSNVKFGSTDYTLTNTYVAP